MKDGKKHGRELVWDDDGTLLPVQPYWGGKCHGIAKQYGRDGRVIGTYKMVHGTYDLWRNKSFDGPYYVGEIHSVRNGLLHGFVWWLNDTKSPSGMKNIGMKASLMASTVSGILTGNSGAAFRSFGFAVTL